MCMVKPGIHFLFAPTCKQDQHVYIFISNIIMYVDMSTYSKFHSVNYNIEESHKYTAARHHWLKKCVPCQEVEVEDNHQIMRRFEHSSTRFEDPQIQFRLTCLYRPIYVCGHIWSWMTNHHDCIGAVVFPSLYAYRVVLLMYMYNTKIWYRHVNHVIDRDPCDGNK